MLAVAAATIVEAATGQKAGLGWALAFELLNDLGFSNVFPVGLALFSRAAPKSLAGLVIGVYYLHLFAAQALPVGSGWLGEPLREKMPAPAFWGDACQQSSPVAAVIMLIIRWRGGKVLA